MKYIDRPKMKVLSVVSAIALSICTMPTALAYSNPPSMDVDSIDNYLDVEEQLFVSEDGDFEFEFEESVPSLPYDSYFTDEDGNIYEYSPSKGEKVTCPHNYKAGKYVLHDRNSSGGCTVITHSAQHCTLCDHIVVGDEISRTIYKVCPHD